MLSCHEWLTRCGCRYATCTRPLPSLESVIGGVHDRLGHLAWTTGATPQRLPHLTRSPGRTLDHWAAMNPQLGSRRFAGEQVRPLQHQRVIVFGRLALPQNRRATRPADGARDLGVLHRFSSRPGRGRPAGAGRAHPPGGVQRQVLLTSSRNAFGLTTPAPTRAHANQPRCPVGRLLVTSNRCGMNSTVIPARCATTYPEKSPTTSSGSVPVSVGMSSM